MKSRRKLLSILLTLSLLVTLLVPMVGPASAGTTNSVTMVPNVTTTQYVNTVIKIDGLSFSGTDQIQVLLPSGAEFQYGDLNAATVPVATLDAGSSVAANTYTAASTTQFAATASFPKVYTPGHAPNTDVANGVYLTRMVTATSSLLAFEIAPYAPGAGNAGYVRVAIPVSVASAASGPVKATIQDTLGAVTAGQLVIGNVTSGNTATTVTSTAAVAQNSMDTVTFLINENVPGSLRADNSDFYVDLPAHFTWGNPAITLAGGFAAGSITKTATTTNSQGNSRLDFTVATASTGMPGTIQVTVPITADYNAPTGDITATFGGTNPGFTASTAVVGTCGNYNITATSGGTPNVFMGQTAQTVGNFTIAEGVAGTLIAGRTISVTLPGGAKWSTAPVPVLNSGSATLSLQTNGGISTDGQTANYLIGGTSTTATNITFTQGQVNVDATGMSGTLTANISGSGLSATVDIAKIVSPVTATAATTPDVVIGAGNQAAGNFTIVESAPGAIMATPSAPQTYTYVDNLGVVHTTTGNQTTSGYLKIIAPSGVTFAGVPTVKVTSGDLNITASGATLMDNNGVLNSVISVPISNGSTTASTIEVSGVNLNIDNSVPAGKVALVIGGNAIVAPVVNGTYVTSVPVANCTSSLTKTNSGGTAKFTIGSTSFTMNGVDQTMDAAPYLKNDRTYLPIRFVAQAVGVTDSNIIWNAADQSVVLIKGGSVIKLVIGSNTMLINGTAITMDTAPEIVDPGRTMLPVRWVAQALGCTINWDDATQTVTVN